MSEEKITANKLIEEGKWEEYCDKKGWNYYIVNEGLLDGNEPLKDDLK